MGPTWIPTKKTMKRYRLKIQPISEGVWWASWWVEKYDSKTADELMSPKTEIMAQKEPKTTSQPWTPPSGNSRVVAAESTRSAAAP